MTVYPVSQPPHIRDSESVLKMMWKRGAAILPVFILATFFSKFETFKALGFSMAAALAAEALAVLWFRKKNFFQDISGFVEALIFTLLISPELPYWMIFIAFFFGIFAGREVFGGLGSHPLPPALLGFAFIQIAFPESAAASPFLDYPAAALAVLLGGIFLIRQRWIAWQVPVLFLATTALLLLPAGVPVTKVFSGLIFFAAFFVASDRAALPLTRKGQCIYTAAAAVMVVVLEKFETGFNPAVFSFLMAGLLSPWLDQQIKPSILLQRHA